MLIAVVFAFVPLPEIEAAPEQTDDLLESATTSQHSATSLFHHKKFLFGLLALFLYVAAQTGVNSFFINYAVEMAHIDKSYAATLLGIGGMGLFMLGRMGGSWLMSFVRAERLLLICALGALTATSCVVVFPGGFGFSALFVVYLCESIMFPTIFALALRGLGRHTKLASSFLIMSIVGGAIAPFLMGILADHHNMALGFIIPLLCFVVIAVYAAYIVRSRQH